MREDSRQAIGRVLGPDRKRSGMELTHTNRRGNGTMSLEIMMLNVSESGHPVFCASSALERGELQSKGNGKSTTHFNGSDETVEVVLRTIISVSQLSMLAEGCEELAWKISKCSEGTGRPVAPND